MKTPFRVLALALLLGPCVASLVHAQIPRTISFQGVLADASGNIVPDGPQNLTLSIYDVATGGTPIFTESQNVTVVRGVFNAIIGGASPNGIPTTLAFDNQYWLGVKIGTGVEIAPRTPFTSVPYSLNAAIAQTALHANTADTATWALSTDTAATLRGGVVTSVNGAQGVVEILGVGATTVTRNGNQFIIRSTDTSGGGIRRIDNFDGSLVIDPPQGPFITMFIREGGVQTHHYRDLSITTPKIANGAVTNEKLGALSISNDKLQTGAVDSRTILNGTIVTEDLADNSVTSPKIVDGQVLTQDIGDLQVTNAKLGADAVTTDKIMDGQVQTADIADGAVTNPKLGADAITTDKIMDGQVQTADIADLNVTNAKLADNSVTTGKIMDGQVLTQDVGLNQIDASRISTVGATTNGQALMYNGAITPVWGNPTAGDLILPFARTQSSASTLFDLTNTGTGAAGNFAVNNAASGVNALTGTTNGLGSGVYGAQTSTTSTAAGVHGASSSTTGGAIGVLGTITSTSPGGFSAGVRGVNNGTGGLGIGVWGSQQGAGWGVYGTAPTGIAVIGSSSSGYGTYGVSSSGVGAYGTSTTGDAGRMEITNSASAGTALRASTVGTGRAGSFAVTNASSTSQAVEVTNSGIGGGITVQLTNAGNGARGIDVTQSGVGPGVFATSVGGNAVWGITSSISSAGVIGDNTFGEAVVGRNRGGNGVGAVVGRNDSSGYGVRGFNTKDGVGVLGQAGISGGTGVAGRFENVNSANTTTALQVATNGTGNGISVQLSNASNGGRGIDVTQSGVGPGVFATSAGGNAVWGITSSISSAGVIGDNTFGEAVVGRNRGGNGVGAVVGRNDSSGYGVRGFNTKNGIGVLGQAGISGGTGNAGRFDNVNAANTSTALIVTTNSTGLAASFTGDVQITGDLTVSGTVAKGGGSFKIDHPLDPTNKYLYHSFVESPDMMNIYNGSVTLDDKGEATVELANWFEALNGEVRYQLTAVGGAAPNLHIAQRVTGNLFRIAGGAPGLEVSWQVTGIRHDAYAKKYRIDVEVDKPETERGTYLHPEAFGQPSRRSDTDATTVGDIGVSAAPSATIDRAAPASTLEAAPSATVSSSNASTPSRSTDTAR